MTGELAIRLGGHNFEIPAPLEMRRAFRLNGHDVQDVVVELALPDPQLWSPWAQGEPARYRAELEITADDRRSASLRETFGIRDVSLQTRAEGWTFAVNGRPMFMRGANYGSQFFLDAAADDLIKSDLDLAKQANMDLLRLNAHVEPPALYDNADRSGMLLWQGLPLIGAHVHPAEARSLAFLRGAPLAPAEALMHLGDNHPSIATHAIHADPPC